MNAKAATAGSREGGHRLTQIKHRLRQATAFYPCFICVQSVARSFRSACFPHRANGCSQSSAALPLKCRTELDGHGLCGEEARQLQRSRVKMAANRAAKFRSRKSGPPRPRGSVSWYSIVITTENGGHGEKGKQEPQIEHG